MDFGISTISHAVLAVFLVIELGLAAYCVDLSNGYWPGSSPSTVSFMLFNTIWSILVLIYIAVVPLYFARAFHSIVAVVIQGITTLFWFSGSLAMAFWVRGPPAATSAFGFLILLVFLALFMHDLIGLLRSRSHSAHADTSRLTKDQA